MHACCWNTWMGEDVTLTPRSTDAWAAHVFSYLQVASTWPAAIIGRHGADPKVYGFLGSSWLPFDSKVELCDAMWIKLDELCVYRIHICCWNTWMGEDVTLNKVVCAGNGLMFNPSNQDVLEECRFKLPIKTYR